MKLLIKDTKNRLRDLDVDLIFIDKDETNDLFVIYAMNEKEFYNIELCEFGDPFIAEYCFNDICENINTGKVFYLKSEEEYRAEIKEFEKIFESKPNQILVDTDEKHNILISDKDTYVFEEDIEWEKQYLKEISENNKYVLVSDTGMKFFIKSEIKIYLIEDLLKE